MNQYRFRHRNVYGKRPLVRLPKVRRKLPRPRSTVKRSLIHRRSVTRSRDPDPHIDRRAI